MNAVEVWNQQREADHAASAARAKAVRREDAGDWERVLERLPAGWEARAREHKAIVRRRKVRSPGDLLRLVLGAAVQGWGRRMVAGWADLEEIACVSDVAVGKRLRQARAWLSAEVGPAAGPAP